MPPLSSMGVGCAGPPKMELLEISANASSWDAPVNLHIQIEELHQSQLGFTRLVAQKGMDIVDAMEGSSNHGH